MRRTRSVDYAGPHTPDPRAYAAVPRGQVVINVISLIVGACWLGVAGREMLLFPVTVVIAAAQLLASVWPTVRVAATREGPVHWAQWLVLIGPMLGGAGCTAVVFWRS
jgi:hypothetical protein